MKQFQFDYEGEDKFISMIKRIRQWCNASVVSNVLFQIYTENMNKNIVQSICGMIEKEMPKAFYMGCSTNGNIILGDKSKGSISIVCTVYEYPSTKIEVLQYNLSEEKAKYVADSLTEYVARHPWVKSIMTYTTMRGMSMTDYCNYLCELPKNIVFCGGGAFSGDINDSAAFVFSSVGQISDHAAVFLMTGGEDYFVEALHVTGWKPLGRSLHVTKADGAVLYELDGKPAYETYYKYLNIKKDDNFFYNTLEFPFLYELNGMDILRAPTGCNSDGSLVMTADITEDVNARIAYGDPWTILDSVFDAATSFQEFIPETFTVFSCAGRRTFWGDDEISKETKPFQSLAPTSGFYTSGEFLRNGDYVNQHNVTLVIEAQREGNIDDKHVPRVEMDRSEFSGKVSMINRLATFIQAATEELEEANKQLQLSAITDGMTKLLNRREIQHRKREKAREFENHSVNGMAKVGASLIMMDIDNFKSVNDNYGHKEGDRVIIALAEMLRKTVAEKCPDASIGRWGGEEFMVLCPSFNTDEAKGLAETFRKKFSDIRFENCGKKTISLGVTELIAGENSDICCVRVDDALYQAKNSGKNKVVVAQ